VASFVRSIDRKIFKYGLSKCYRIANANLYVRSSLFLKKIPVSWIRSIDVEPIARCNLECPFCQVPGWHRAVETEPMGLELFERIINQFPNLKHIKLQGMGEPFLNRNLTEMIRMASARHIKTTILTNGTLLNRSLAEEVLEAGLANLYFSFDGGTKKTYESLRIGADFAAVVGNIRNVCELKRKGAYSTSIQIRCLVCSQAVLNELGALVELAADVGADRVYVAGSQKVWKREGRKTYPAKCINIYSYANHASEILKAENKANKFKIDFKVEQIDRYKKTYPCSTPWKTLFVAVEGKIVPCNHIASPDTWCVGNLMDDDLNEIWNNSYFVNLRKSIAINGITKYCTNCY